MEFQFPVPFRMGINWKNSEAHLTAVIKRRAYVKCKTLGPGVSILVAPLEPTEELLNVLVPWALPRMSRGQPQALVIFQSFLDGFQCAGSTENYWPIVAVRQWGFIVARPSDLSILITFYMKYPH